MEATSFINVNYTYPNNPEFEYTAELKRINLDDERMEDLSKDNGFIVSEPQSIKKDIKSPNSIFSYRFGQTLSDVNPYANRYRCRCGTLSARIYHGVKCPVCGEEVQHVGDNFGYFGYIVLKDPYYIIHPNLFKSIQAFIGNKPLDGIINTNDEKDQNGFSIKQDKPKDQPFFGIGMMDFKERFNEIMDYYLRNIKTPDKAMYYDDIMKDRDKVFIQSIPVYTTHLRPFRIKDDSFTFEGTNDMYNMMCKLAATINKDALKIQRKKKTKDQLLYDLQMKYNELDKELGTSLSGKRGSIRSLFGGRYNYSCRSVIVPDYTLRIDQVRLPYKALVELLSQSIINVLKRTYSISFSDACKIWYRSTITKDKRVYDIIMMIIREHKNGIYDNITGDTLDTFQNSALSNKKNENINYGIPILINRNPTIQYGGILQMYCIGINDNYSMSLPLPILPLLNADFDGDCLNILYLINKAFISRAEEVFNPRNALYISRNDGYFNNDVNHQRDIIINANALIQLSRDKYTLDDLNQVYKIQSMSDEEYDSLPDFDTAS